MRTIVYRYDDKFAKVKVEFDNKVILDWMFHKYEEEIFDCNSGGIPHKHCMNTMVAEIIV